MTDARATLRVQGMTIATPPGWQDKSMLVVSAEEPGPSGVTPTLVVTRETSGEPPQDGASALETFVDRQIDQVRVALSNFSEASRRRAGVADPSAELVIDCLSAPARTDQASAAWAWRNSIAPPPRRTAVSVPVLYAPVSTPIRCAAITGASDVQLCP